MAWGFFNGQFTPRTFAQRASAEGYAWAAVEFDDEQTANYNRQLWPDFKWECESHGIIPGVWFTEGANIRLTPHDAGLSIAELEGPGDYDGIMLVIGEQALPSCPLAVCTNFNVPLTDSQGVPQPDKAAPLIAAKFTCLTESYLGDNPAATPDSMNFMAQQLGWPTSQPVFGVHNASPVVYAQWAGWPGVDYLGEYVL